MLAVDNSYEFPTAHLRPQAPQPPTTISLIFSSRQEKANEESGA